ncbi:hypothetical protein [Nesterenkonia sp. HG001]|uniref:hypothetical protein n=1 Tax=Nesterenkonia sp. HG001 TaxID=2983207 RepID=UPI002AC5D111|nr:hypothetical protein [Nesterenkonia sp. HG001]MDZ5076980.1 hypothetical protein [Nesterenkonia sp. HG001]
MTSSLIASSSDGLLPIPALRGYAQVGGNFIFGESGRRVYGQVPAGHDGAYVSVTRNALEQAVVGTDDAGYGRLFLYQRGHRWALGTSLIELAEYVNECRWPLAIDELQFRGFLLSPKGMIGSQLLSLDTIFREIRLLAPREEAVVCSGARTTISIRWREEARPVDYQEALQDALDEMVGRLTSILQAGVPLASDITGGRDSRTVLAGLKVANESSVAIGDIVRFRSNPKLVDDWRVATALDEKYGLRLNRNTSADSYFVDLDHGYRVWRAHDLGTYTPLYQFRSYTAEITLSGAAGGVHRSVYREEFLRDRLGRLKTSYVSDADVSKLSRRIDETLDYVSGHPDRRLEHFRQFRNRFHGGRVPLRTHNVAPLASRRLKVASGLMTDAHLDRAQFYADIMLNLAPDLAKEPYDSASKGWGDEHYRDLTRVRVNPDRFQGAVYGEMEHPPREISPAKKPLEPFMEAFHAAAPGAIECGLLSSTYVARAREALESTEGRRFEHAIKGRGVSTVILAGEAARLSTSF